MAQTNAELEVEQYMAGNTVAAAAFAELDDREVLSGGLPLLEEARAGSLTGT